MSLRSLLSDIRCKCEGGHIWDVPTHDKYPTPYELEKSYTPSPSHVGYLVRKVRRCYYCHATEAWTYVHKIKHGRFRDYEWRRIPEREYFLIMDGATQTMSPGRRKGQDNVSKYCDIPVPRQHKESNVSDLAENYKKYIKEPIVIQLTDNAIEPHNVCRLLYTAFTQLRIPVQTEFIMPEGVGVVTLQCGYGDTVDSLKIKAETIAMVRKEIRAAQSQLAGR
jgi:hypothetical protein